LLGRPNWSTPSNHRIDSGIRSGSGLPYHTPLLTQGAHRRSFACQVVLCAVACFVRNGFPTMRFTQERCSRPCPCRRLWPRKCRQDVPNEIRAAVTVARFPTCYLLLLQVPPPDDRNALRLRHQLWDGGRRTAAVSPLRDNRRIRIARLSHSLRMARTASTRYTMMSESVKRREPNSVHACHTVGR
jgi:hypothetical protein